MFLEKQIEELGNSLLAKAGIKETTHFSIVAPFWMRDAYSFDADERIVYAIPERNFYEFKHLAPQLWGKFETGPDAFLEVQKISIAHEVGHALQKDLTEKSHMLYELKTPKQLAALGSKESLYEHIKKYHSIVLDTEKEAWDFAWALMKEDTNEELFNIIRSHALDTYEQADFLESEYEFFETYEYLSSACNMDLVGFEFRDNQEIVQIKMVADGVAYQGELIRDNEYTWIKENVKRYNPSTKEWEAVPSSFNLDTLAFAIEDLKQNLKTA